MVITEARMFDEASSVKTLPTLEQALHDATTNELPLLIPHVIADAFGKVFDHLSRVELDIIDVAVEQLSHDSNVNRWTTTLKKSRQKLAGVIAGLEHNNVHAISTVQTRDNAPTHVLAFSPSEQKPTLVAGALLFVKDDFARAVKSGIADQWVNPLNGIRTSAELMIRSKDEATHSSAITIFEATKRLESQTTALVQADEWKITMTPTQIKITSYQYQDVA